jgi:hypothetical protein
MDLKPSQAFMGLQNVFFGRLPLLLKTRNELSATISDHQAHGALNSLLGTKLTKAHPDIPRDYGHQPPAIPWFHSTLHPPVDIKTSTQR